MYGVLAILLRKKGLFYKESKDILFYLILIIKPEEPFLFCCLLQFYSFFILKIDVGALVLTVNRVHCTFISL